MRAHEPHPTCQGCYTSSCQVSCDRLTAPKFKRSLCRSRRPDLLSSAGFERTAECRSQDALHGEVEEFILGSARVSASPTLQSGRPTPSLSWHGCPCCTLKCAVITIQCQGTDQKRRSYQLSHVAHIISNQHVPIKARRRCGSRCTEATLLPMSGTIGAPSFTGREHVLLT